MHNFLQRVDSHKYIHVYGPREDYITRLMGEDDEEDEEIPNPELPTK